MKFFTLAFLLITLTNILNFGQWSSDPDVNLAISDSTDRQSADYIISTPDGGCYVSWYNYESGNFNVYMQRLDPWGNKLWGQDGLLISDHHSTVLWVAPVMSLDLEENVVLTFRDYRNLSEVLTIAYKISSNGDFLWGPDGINVYDSNYDHINQQITQLNDGSSIISFTIESNPTKIALQKISSDGIKLWGGQPVIIESTTENYWYYYIVPTDNNSVIVIHTATNYPITKLRAIKVNEDGSFGWETMIQNLGGVLSNYLGKIAVSSDSINGAIIAWTDDRNSVGLHNVYFQRISSNGLIYYPENGIQASINPSINQIQPLISYDYLNDEIYTNWLETDSTMHRYGITCQKFSANGTRLWGDTGITYKELSDYDLNLI
jgi:hypothetical protein